MQNEAAEVGNRSCYGALLIVDGAAAALAFAQDNLRDGAPFNGYTGVTFDTTRLRLRLPGRQQPGPGRPANKKFKTLQAAYAAAPAGTPDHPTVIGIKPDVYLMHVGESRRTACRSPRTTSPSSA